MTEARTHKPPSEVLFTHTPLAAGPDCVLIPGRSPVLSLLSTPESPPPLRLHVQRMVCRSAGKVHERCAGKKTISASFRVQKLKWKFLHHFPVTPNIANSLSRCAPRKHPAVCFLSMLLLLSAGEEKEKRSIQESGSSGVNSCMSLK